MPKIQFQKLTIEGFGSIIDEKVVDLNTQGLTVVRGQNGAGKSTIFNALYWVLYNKSIKNISKSEIPTWENLRPESFKGTRVIVDFTIDGDQYSIARHIKYNGKTFGLKGSDSLVLIKNGEKVTENLYKNDQQAHINLLLGMEPKVFLHTAFFAQKTNRFISASPEEKRLVLDTLFNFERIDKAQQLASLDASNLDKKIQSYNKDYNELKLSISKLTDEINHAKEKLSLHEEFKQKQLADLNEQLLSTESLKLSSLETLKTLEANKVLYESELTKFSSLEADKVSALQSRDSVVKSKNDQVNTNNKEKEELWKLEQLYSGICNRCGQDFGTFKPEEVIAKEESLKQSISTGAEMVLYFDREIQKYSDQIESLTVQLSQKSGFQVSLTQTLNQLKVVQELITSYDSKLESLKTKKLEVENQKFEYDFNLKTSELEKLISDISNLERVISEAEAEFSRIKFFATIGFTAKGLKAYLFEHKLRLLNQYVYRYSSLLGFTVELAVDLESALKSIEINIAKDGVRCDYGCLSGGEQQRVDLCIAFALHDLISANYNLNILILDEVFESIDTYQGVEQVSELINFKSMNKSVFVITHNASLEIPNSNILNV